MMMIDVLRPLLCAWLAKWVDTEDARKDHTRVIIDITNALGIITCLNDIMTCMNTLLIYVIQK